NFPRDRCGRQSIQPYPRLVASIGLGYCNIITWIRPDRDRLILSIRKTDVRRNGRVYRLYSRFRMATKSISLHHFILKPTEPTIGSYIMMETRTTIPPPHPAELRHRR